MGMKGGSKSTCMYRHMPLHPTEWKYSTENFHTLRDLVHVFQRNLNATYVICFFNHVFNRVLLMLHLHWQLHKHRDYDVDALKLEPFETSQQRQKLSPFLVIKLLILKIVHGALRLWWPPDFSCSTIIRLTSTVWTDMKSGAQRINCSDPGL